MKILVTGGCGFIGSNLIRSLVRKGYAVVNLDKLTYAGNLASLSDLTEHAGYAFEKVDICDPDALRGVFAKHKPDAVMHLAAESHVDRSIDGPGAFIQTNIVGTYLLLEASLAYWRGLSGQAKEAFRFLNVSTDEVYGSLGRDDPAFTEATGYAPHSPYSASKAGADHLARAWGDTYGLPVLVTNCSNNYGPFQFPEKLVPVVVLKCLTGESIPIYGDGKNVRDWLYVEDHAEALELVLRRGRVGETYNIGGNNERENLALVETLCDLLDELRPGKAGTYRELITFVQDRPGHDRRYAIDSEKIKNELGWEPKEGVASGFEKTIRWYLDNAAWWQPLLSGKDASNVRKAKDKDVS